MNSTARILLSLTLFLGLALPLKAENSHPWLIGKAGYHEAMQIQKKTGDPVLLYFFTTWCPYCKSFEKNILSTAQVETALDGVPKVLIDVDQEKELAQQYGIDRFPLVYVVKDKKIEPMNTAGTGESFIEEARALGLKVR